MGEVNESTNEGQSMMKGLSRQFIKVCCKDHAFPSLHMAPFATLLISFSLETDMCRVITVQRFIQHFCLVHVMSLRTGIILTARVNMFYHFMRIDANTHNTSKNLSPCAVACVSYYIYPTLPGSQ